MFAIVSSTAEEGYRVIPVLRRQSDRRTDDPRRRSAVRVRAYELFVGIGCDGTRADECWSRALEEAGACGTVSSDRARSAADSERE